MTKKIADSGGFRMKGKKIYLGFDIGGTKIAVCLGTADGTILGSERITNADRDPKAVMNEMVSAAERLLASSGASKADLAAIGIGAPGPLDIVSGVMEASPNMKKWDKIPIVDFISGHFSCKTCKTYIDNDANAGALAEWIFGAGRGRKNLIYLTMSTGIGGGIIAENMLIRGRDLNAGELGHVVLDPNGPSCNCGLKGCYEAFCGGKSVSQRIISDLAGQEDHLLFKIAGADKAKIGYPALIEAVKMKNGYAMGLWDEICLRNAQALGAFVNIFNPELIIMGTIALAAGDLLLDPVRKLLPRFTWPRMLKNMEILPSRLGRKIGEYSALSVAVYYDSLQS